MENTALKIKVTVLSRCAEEHFGGYSHDSKIILEIPLKEYNILAKILCKNISLLYRLGINSLLKEELLRDSRTIRTILEKSEKEVIK